MDWSMFWCLSGIVHEAVLAQKQQDGEGCYAHILAQVFWLA